MAAGPRSLLAFWMGGASAPAEQAGVRGMLAPWIGGAAAPVVADEAGVRSLLAFWIGGAAAGPALPPEPPTPSPGGGLGYYQLPTDLRAALRQRRIDEDDLLLLLAASIDGRSLH